MDFETFAKGMAFIAEAWPRREINVKLYYNRLKDLPDKDFEDAVFDLVDNTQELFPDSNLIAILKAKTLQVKSKRYLEANEQKERQRYLDWEKDQKQIEAK